MALLDTLHGVGGDHVLERADGLVDVMSGADYLSGPDDWPEWEVTALERVSGRVLDVGAGAGRHCLALQAKGDEPTALDTSPGAIEVCEARGVNRTFLGPISALAEKNSEPFDAAILMGNNLGLLGSPEQATDYLDALRHLLVSRGTVVGTCVDPYVTDNLGHLAYHEQNRRAGRMAGQATLRVRYGYVATEWFDYLFVSPNELRQLAADAGWRVEETTEPQPTYVAVLRPDR